MGTAVEPIVAPGPEPPVALERWAARWIAAHNARDATALAALMTENVTIVNHRQIATWDELHGPRAWLKVQEALWTSSPDAHYSFDGLVAGDELVAITRWRVGGHMEPGGGEWAFSFLATGLFRGERVEHVELFDEDDEAGVCACAERLRAAVVGESATVRLIRRYTDAVNAHDWEAAEACLTDDLEAFDHRVASPLGRERDRATYDAQIRALADQAGDFRIDYELIADLDEVGAIRGAWRGHLNDGGGEFETPMVTVGRRRGDQWDRLEVFDPDDDAAWAGGVAELLGERGASLAVGARSLGWWSRATGTPCLPPTPPTRPWSTTARWEPGRSVGRTRCGTASTAAWSSSCRTFVRTSFACSTLRRTLFSICIDTRGHAAQGGEIEVPSLLLARVREGLIDLWELFDQDDEQWARRRFEELVAEAEPSLNVRLVRRLTDALNARDWDAAEACVTDDASMVNHVWLAAAPGERDWRTWRDQFQALVDSASDAQGTFEVLADLAELIAVRSACAVT